MNKLRKITLQIINALYQKIDSGKSLKYNSSSLHIAAISSEKYKNIFDNSIVGKSITSLDGKLETNKSFGEILGYSENELSQLKWHDITHPEEVEASEKITTTLLSGERVRQGWKSVVFTKTMQLFGLILALLYSAIRMAIRFIF